MIRSVFSWKVLVSIALVVLVFGGIASAATVSVRFLSQGQLVLLERPVPDGMAPTEAAVRALVAGPTVEELAIGITSRIPTGVSITTGKLSISDTSAEVELSAKVLAGLDEAGLQDIFEQFRTTLGDFPLISAIKLTCNGKLLSSYLSLAPNVSRLSANSNPISTSGVGLGGHTITIGPSHGRYWNSSYGWLWQRSDPCGFGEAVLEDTNSIRLCQFLSQYLAQDGATVHCARELNEANCCNGDTGLAWWKMCAESWLHANGLPCSVWASYSGNCGGDTATDRNSDDIRARPLFADYRGTEIYIAHHTNAGGGTGTETWRDTTMEHPTWVGASLNLANAVQGNVISAIRDMYDGGWADRGVKDSTGNFGEIRIPNRPACLIELAFHDNCSRDASYLTDDFFRSVAEWGLYKGVCAYFGNTPTWDKYSDEYVSDTIPTTMEAGHSYNVSVTFRNRGVCWFTSRGFRLGAVGESDPFTSFTRVDISGEVKPGINYTFNFTMTAPGSGGTFTTDWRMVRDGVAWFGATLTKTVIVSVSGDTQPPTVPQNLHRTGATSSSISLAWNASTDNYGVAGYRIYRNSAQVGTATGTSYTDSGLTANTGYSYQVDAYDGVPNYSAKSTSLATGTGGTWSRANASQNCYVRSGTPDVCGVGGIAAGYSTTGTLLIRRGLVQWDMTGGPTQAETINAANSVRVSLYQYTQTSTTYSGTISLYKVNNDWNESNGTWNNVGIGAIYTGASVACVNVGDRTWSWNGNTEGIPPANRGVYVKNDTSETINSPSKVFDNRTNIGGSNLPPRLAIDYVDLTAPSNCSISINSGDTYMTSTAATLTLSATDTLSGMSQMQFSNDGTNYSAAEAYAASKGYTLPGGDGLKTVYVKFRDAVGNWSSAVSDTITLDTAPPTGTISINGGATYATSSPVTLTLSSADAAQMQFKNEAGAWSGWEAYAATKSWPLSTGDGAKTVYAQFKDAAGNVSTGTISDGIILDTTAPTISIGAPSVTSTGAGPVTYTITYGGADAVTLANGDVTLNKTHTANAGSVVVSGIGLTTRTVTISGITGNGTLGISIAAGTASDLAGHTAPAAGPSATFAVVNHVPSYGLNNKAVADAIMGTASGGFVFTVWGKVTTIDANSFTVDDGSRAPVTVIFAGHGLTNVDYASATGTLDVSGASPVLTAQVVKKWN